jgi:Tol biopolymer transport system component
MALAEGTRIGPYEVLGVAGKGGMGEVYRARDTRLGRVVALKVLPAELSADVERRLRLEQVARVVSSLSSPHICTLFDIGHAEGFDYLVMEFLEGETLQQRLLAGPLPRDQVLRYGGEIASALNAAHRIGVVHRDLKPGNIMLTRVGAVLLDFGLARFNRPVVSGHANDRPTETLRLTTEGTIMGTWQYMAPEQIEGGEADARTDIFALGATLYEMATGLPAFSGRTKASLIASIMASSPSPPSSQPRVAPGLGPAFDRVVRRCLEKDPENRWQSARDVALELSDIARTPLAGETTSGTRSATGRERLSWLVAGVCAVTAIAAGLAYVRAPRAMPAPTARLSLLPPPQSAFTEVKLSPDGRHLAFTTSGAKAQAGVWIRAFDGDSSVMVPGTAGAQSLTWSPDGRYVGFLQDGNFKRVEAVGGAPEVLCQLSLKISPVSQIAWSPEGILLVSSTVYQPLQQVRLSDCSVTSLGSLDTSQKEIGRSAPSFLPDGHHFLYTSNRLLPDKGVDVCVGALGSGDRTLLVHNASQPAYAAPGSLMFSREGKLLVQPFDAATLRLSGEAAPASPDQVVSNHFDGQTTYGVSGGDTLVYLPDTPVPFQLEWRDSSGARQATIGEAGANRLIQLSPDGRSILIARRALDTGTEDLWIVDSTSGVSRRVTFDRTMLTEGRWTPDGRQIVYMARRGAQFGLYRRSLDRDSEDLLLQTPFWRGPRAVSPDQRVLLFEDYSTQTGYDLWSLEIGRGRAPTAVIQTPFDEGGATFSPDGRLVAYVSNKSGRDEIYVTPFPIGGAEWKVSTGVAGHIGGGSDVAMVWRADGRELYYTSDDWSEMAVPIGAGPTPDAPKPRPLFSLAAGSQVSVTSDGRRFLVNASLAGDRPLPLTVVLNWTAARSGN